MFGSQSRPGLASPVFFCRNPAPVLNLTIILRLALPVLLAWGSLSGVHAHEPPVTKQSAHAQSAELPRVPLEIADRRITAEVAADDSSRARGLMFRERLPADHGMLFVFPEASQQCFWMKNTPLPLSLAFIDDQGRIISLADMEPHSLQPHCAIAPALYALEMEQGWFARHGAGPGTPVHGLPRVQRRAAK